MSDMPSPLTAEQVHIWYRLTDGIDSSELAAAHGQLSAREQERCNRFRQSHDRRDYAVAHALLRSALSHYVDAPPESWTFSVGDCGKPDLSRDSRCNVTFNLSHTRGLVACAFGLALPIGIDAVRTDPGFDCAAVASRYLASEELAHLHALPIEDQSDRFMELWALKEAYAKATGRGLSEDIVDVRFLIDGNQVRFLPPRDVDPALWQFGLFTPAPHFRLAVAIECRTPRQCSIQVRSVPLPHVPSNFSALAG